MLWPCVCVHPSQFRVLLKRLNESRLFFAWKLPSANIVHCIVREFVYLQNKGTSFCYCPKLWAWKISLWQIDLVVNKKSLMVKLVDLTYNRHT